jgi:hypothetical protein
VQLDPPSHTTETQSPRIASVHVRSTEAEAARTMRGSDFVIKDKY